MEENNEEKVVNKSSGLATAGMVLGIVAICISFISFFEIITEVCALLAFIFSIISLIKKASKGQAIAGFILSILSVVIIVNRHIAYKRTVETITAGISGVTNSITDSWGKITNTITDSVNKVQESLKVDENSIDKMTMDKFNKITTGMTYEEVTKIVGSEGKLSTESSYGGYSFKMYVWEASNGIASASVSFTNGKVSAKSQLGL